MVLTNLCRKSKRQSECKEIIRLQWALYAESDYDTQEKEEILWEIAKTINNTVKSADNLEECQMYSEEIQRILSFDDIQSEKVKENILLEYGKSLVNRFIFILPTMVEQRKACLKELESLYLDAEQRNSDLKDQFRVRLMIGLDNALRTCGHEDEVQEYHEKLAKLLELQNEV